MFIYETKSINCYVCSTATSAACADPFNSNGSTSTNQIYCEVSFKLLFI